MTRLFLPVRQCHAFKQACESGVNAQPSGAQWSKTVGLTVRFINGIKVRIIKSCASPPDWVAVRWRNHEMSAVDHLSSPDWSGSRSGVHTGQVVIRIRIGLWIRYDLVGLCSFWILCLCHRCWSSGYYHTAQMQFTEKTPKEARCALYSTAYLVRTPQSCRSKIKRDNDQNSLIKTLLWAVLDSGSLRRL